MDTSKTSGVISGGWGGATLNVLYTVFIVAIIFGVILTATAITSSTINTIAPITNSLVTTPGGNIGQNILSTNSLVITCTGACSWISTSRPATVTVVGNGIGVYATNEIFATRGTQLSQTFTLTSATFPQTLTATNGNYYNISVVSISGFGSSAEPSFTVTVTQNALSVTHLSVPSDKTTNVISAVAVQTVSEQTIGTSSSTSSGVFGSIATYLVTVANFTGIIILLAIIIVVVSVIYLLFGKSGQGNM